MPAQRATAFGVLALQEVAPARVGTENLACARDLEPLGHGFLGFDAFWTAHIYVFSFSKKSAQYMGAVRQEASGNLS